MPNVKDSFFNIFSFSHMMHDAIDYGLVYEDVEILQDIVLDGSYFSKGETFHQVNFSFRYETFSFFVWGKPDPANRTVIPETLKVVSQKAMAPLLRW